MRRGRLAGSGRAAPAQEAEDGLEPLGGGAERLEEGRGPSAAAGHDVDLLLCRGAALGRGGVVVVDPAERQGDAGAFRAHDELGEVLRAEVGGAAVVDGQDLVARQDARRVGAPGIVLRVSVVGNERHVVQDLFDTPFSREMAAIKGRANAAQFFGCCVPLPAV